MLVSFSKYRFVVFGYLFVSACFAGNITKENSYKDNSFVIKKNVKKENIKLSKSKLQEDICTIFVDQISCVPDISQKTSQMQKILLENTCKYLESASDSIVLKYDKKRMDEILRVSKNFGEKMENFVQDCNKYLEYLKNLK